MIALNVATAIVADRIKSVLDYRQSNREAERPPNFVTIEQEQKMAPITDVQPVGKFEEKDGIIQATKFDGLKTRFALVPARAHAEVADVLTYAARPDGKYSAGNWKEGDSFDYDRLISAAERHIIDFKLGKRYDDDPQSGKYHILANAICELYFLLELDLTGHGTDNRDVVQYLPNGVEPRREVKTDE